MLRRECPRGIMFRNRWNTLNLSVPPEGNQHGDVYILITGSRLKDTITWISTSRCSRILYHSDTIIKKTPEFESMCWSQIDDRASEGDKWYFGSVKCGECRIETVSGWMWVLFYLSLKWVFHLTMKYLICRIYDFGLSGRVVLNSDHVFRWDIPSSPFPLTKRSITFNFDLHFLAT